MPKTKDGGWILDDSGMSPYEPISEEEARKLRLSGTNEVEKKAVSRKKSRQKKCENRAI